MGIRGKTGTQVKAVDAFVAARSGKPTKRANGAPGHLGKDGVRFYDAICQSHGITDPAALATLTVASECLDALAACRAAIARDGLFQTTQYGTPRQHPAISVAKQNRDGFFGAMRLLKINVATNGSGDDPPPWA